MFALHALDHIRLTDRLSIGIARSFELCAQDLFLGPRFRTEVHAPLGEDDAALTLDGVLIERRGLRPVLEHEEGAIEDARHIGRHPQRVLRLVVTGRGIRVGTDPQAERRQKLNDALLRKILGAFEQHVFDEVGDALLVVVFEDRTGFDDEPQFGLVRRLAVAAHVVPQPVRERTDEHFRIDGHGLRQRVIGDRRGARLAAGRRCLRGRDGNRAGKHGNEQQATGEAKAREFHMLHPTVPAGRP